MKVILAALTASLFQQPAPRLPADSAEPARRIVATLQLAAQEYRLAFQGTQVVNASEWEEARLFVAEARRAVPELPAALASRTAAQLARAAQFVAERAPAESLASLAAAVARDLTRAFGSLDEQPPRAPSLAAGARVWRAQCRSCHGESGRGDGPAAAALNPPPANLADPAALAATTPLDAYRRVMHGVPGTAMPSFAASLTEQERWDVVAHVFALHDRVAREADNGRLALVFGAVRGALGGARELAARGETAMAARRALEAYMAFEAVEAALGATDPGLVARVETRFGALREALTAARKPAHEIAAADTAVLAALDAAERALAAGRSPVGLFLESLALLLREGFEAILVIGAIMAVLLQAGALERRRHVRWGIGLALVASLFTAALIEWIFRITPAQQEALEGGVMLLAAAVLFYVSYWLISKVESAAWTRFVRGRIQRAVASGSALALFGVAFLAVYREGFETVLFYKALYVTGGTGGAAAITGGMLLGLAGLVALYVGIERFGMRVPMRPFFAVTGATLAYMAFVFAGKGVRELQEGGLVATTLLRHGPHSGFLGVFPTVETLTVQAIIVLAILGALGWTFVVQPRRLAAAAAIEPIEPAPEQETATV